MDIKDIIRAAGGPVVIAKAIGTDHSAVSKWKHVPLKRLLKIAELTGHPPEKLRPDLAPIIAMGRDDNSQHDSRANHATVNGGEP